MKTLQKLTLLFLIASLATIGCKKKEDDATTPPAKTSEYEQGSNDETARDEYDQSIDDIFKSLDSTDVETGRTNGVILPCGVVKIDTTGGKYRFVYDSTSTCYNRVLSGSITAALITGTKWKDVGAQIELTYTNYRVYFNANQEILEFNGVLTVTNVNGGKLVEVLNPTNKTIVHTIAGNLNITFNNNTTRSWTVTKKRTFSSTDGQFSGLSWTLSANGTVAEVGIAKDGSPFTTTIPIPLKWINCGSGNTYLGPFVLTEGELVYTTGNNSMTAEAGYTYNIATNVMTKAGDCSSKGFKLTFSISGSKTVQFQYY